MARRTLAETIYEEEVSSFYNKTATSYAFGYENCSSGFGSGNGSGFKPFDFNVPSVVDVFREKPKSSSSYGTSSWDKPESEPKYTINPKGPFTSGVPSNFGVNNIGSRGSGFEKGDPGNLRLDIGEGIQERYDFSGHHNTEPHLNLDLKNYNKRDSRNILGSEHFVTLWPNEKKKLW